MPLWIMRNPFSHLAGLAVLFVVTLAFCTAAVLDGPPRGHNDPAFDALRNADIVPGEGIGDLQVGVLTLGECIDDHGTGHVAVLAGDDYGLELAYLGRALMLTFWLADHQQVDVPWERLKRAALGELPDLLLAFPELRDIPLRSLVLAPRDHDVDSCMLRGEVAGLVPLGGDPRPLVDVLGIPTAESLVEERREDLDDDGEETEDEVVFELRRQTFDGIALEWTRERDAAPKMVAITVWAPASKIGR